MRSILTPAYSLSDPNRGVQLLLVLLNEDIQGAQRRHLQPDGEVHRAAAGVQAHLRLGPGESHHLLRWRHPARQRYLLDALRQGDPLLHLLVPVHVLSISDRFLRGLGGDQEHHI